MNYSIRHFLQNKVIYLILMFCMDPFETVESLNVRECEKFMQNLRNRWCCISRNTQYKYKFSLYTEKKKIQFVFKDLTFHFSQSLQPHGLKILCADIPDSLSNCLPSVTVLAVYNCLGFNICEN